MKLLTITLTLLLLAGCDKSASEHKPGESHEEHARHDKHEGEKHNHKEHGGEEDNHGEEDGHDDHDDHDEGGHDEHGGEEDEENTVHIPASAVKKGTVVLGQSQEGVLKDALEVPAEVQLPPDHIAHVSPLVEGQLLNVKVGIGQEIKKGQALATLRSVTLGRARAEYARTTALRDVAKRTLERQEKLREEGISSERSYLDAKSAYEQAGAERSAARSGLSVFGAAGGSGPDMTLVSPIAGTLVERHATNGENVSPSDSLFIIADTSKVWVIGQAYERQLSRVVPEMKATLTLTAFPSKSWDGTVSYVGATITETTRTLPIRVELDNEDGLLRPGLFGRLRLFPAKGATPGVLVPLTAIQDLNGVPVIFVPGDEPGEFRSVPVTLGRENKVQVEVVKGLAANEAIVVEGGFILKSELIRGQLGHGHAH